MRIPLPTRFNLKHAAAFTVAVFALQQAAGTDLLFSILCGFFTMLSVLAFNIAGGLAYPSGAFIFFFATLSSIVGITYKAILFEPAQSHLKAPNLTMAYYCASMVVIALVAYVNKRLVPKRGLLAEMSLGPAMRKAALGAFIVGVVVQILTFLPSEAGSFLNALRQINSFNLVAILLATFYEVQTSGGRRSSNWIVWASVSLAVFFGGVLGFSKQGFLTAPVAWLIAAITAGHNFSKKQIIGILLGYMFFSTYVVPYSQVGRDYRGDNPGIAADWETAKEVLSSYGSVKQQFKENGLTETEKFEEIPHLYDAPQGFFDRLNMLSPDDALVAYTEDGNYEGLLPTYVAFTNIIPHFLWPDKPYFYTGNTYGREIGMIGEDDFGTGISFTPIADSYHQVGWYGLLLLAGILAMLFFVMDGLSGDVRRSPWGLLFTVIVAHNAPEGLISGQVYVATYTAFGVVVVASLTKYVLPILSGVMTNSERTRINPGAAGFATITTPAALQRSSLSTSASAAGSIELPDR